MTFKKGDDLKTVRGIVNGLVLSILLFVFSCAGYSVILAVTHGH